MRSSTPIRFCFRPSFSTSSSRQECRRTCWRFSKVRLLFCYATCNQSVACQGTPVILLRNLQPKRGLCNGTRLIVRSIAANVLDCEFLSGPRAGHREFIPKLWLTPSDTGLDIKFRRHQFPVRVSYAMTINKYACCFCKRLALQPLQGTVSNNGQSRRLFADAVLCPWPALRGNVARRAYGRYQGLCATQHRVQPRPRRLHTKRCV